MNGLDMQLLGKRLYGAGFRIRTFSYPTLSAAPGENAAQLAALMKTLESDTVHLVAHSLGGLVVRHLMAMHPNLPHGRAVTLGTPHGGSHVARKLDDWRLAPLLLGRAAQRGLLGDLPAWPGTRELGSVAGTLRVGLGMFTPGLPEPNDGTVAVQETVVEGMADHLELPVTHMGMLFSQDVAEAVIGFLRSGRFAR